MNLLLRPDKNHLRWAEIVIDTIKYIYSNRANGNPATGTPLSAQNSRVTDLAGDRSTIQTQNVGSIAAGDDGVRTTIDEIIEQAYRQIYFHAMRCDRDPTLNHSSEVKI